MLLKVKIYLYFVVISVFGFVLLILFQYICCALLKRSITIIVCPAHIHSNARTHARTNNVWVCSLPSYSPIDPSAVLYCTSYTLCLRTPPSSLSFFLSFFPILRNEIRKTTSSRIAISKTIFFTMQNFFN
jgi:hypothetical protein